MRTSCLLFSTGRAASTAIYQYLDVAGELGLPKNKEPHHFCDLSKYEGIYDLMRQIYVSGESEYCNLYSESKLLLDASCGYFFCLNDVLRHLSRLDKKPKVIFLYREPVDRAFSWFYERKKKGLTKAANVIDDMIQASKLPQGLWWEYYYDNVFYDAGYNQIRSHFDHVLSINYDYFARHQKETIATILEYLGINPVALDQLDLRLVNSAAEAQVISAVRAWPLLREFGSLVPSASKNWLLSRYLNYQKKYKNVGLKTRSKEVDQVIDLLPESTIEYERFRRRLGHQDIYVS